MTRLSFATLPTATILAICDYLEGDGHGIYLPGFLSELGVPEAHIASVVRTYTSDGTHKGSIYAPATPGLPGLPIVPRMTGVYSLDLYRRLGYSGKSGRIGFIHYNTADEVDRLADALARLRA